MKPRANTGILFIFALANGYDIIKEETRFCDKEFHMNTVHDILKQFDRLSKAELAMISKGLLNLL